MKDRGEHRQAAGDREGAREAAAAVMFLVIAAGALAGCSGFGQNQQTAASDPNVFPANASTKEAPLPGLMKNFSTSHKFLGANAGAAGIVTRYFTVLFVHFLLLLAGLTGFLFLSLLLLLARLLPAAALLLLLVTLIRYDCSFRC